VRVFVQCISGSSLENMGEFKFLGESSEEGNMEYLGRQSISDNPGLSNASDCPSEGIDTSACALSWYLFGVCRGMGTR